MKIKFLNNQLWLINFSEKDSARIGQLKVDLREDILDWSSNVRAKTFSKGCTIIDLFSWEGMSTWWIGKLVHKNSFDSNQWLNQLLVMHICKYYCDDYIIDVETDDAVLIKTILANFSMTKINLIPINQNKFFSFRFFHKLINFKKFIFSLFRELQNFILLCFFKDDKVITEDGIQAVWFRTLFPINWPGENSKTDRLFGKTPLQDTCFGYNARYLVYISRSKKDQKSSLMSLSSRISALRTNSGREIYFPQKKITLKDIIQVYLSSYVEMRYFHRLAKQPSFRNIFFFNNMDLSNILLSEWSTVYLGLQQQSKLQAIATAKFFSTLADGQTVVTYGEFFATNRATYYLTKRKRPKTTFIAIQHATNARNKMFTYFRKEEFKLDGNVQGKYFSPYPDYFLAQGKQYKEILAEFYDKSRIEIIGSMRSIPESLSDNLKVTNNAMHSSTKILLLAPSVGDDYKIIFDFLMGWKYIHKWNILLSPHPTTEINAIKSYQRRQCPDLKIQYILNKSTYDLLASVDIVMASSSSVALEASFFNTSAVRVYSLGTIPQFDLDERIPSFDSKTKFKDWFESQNFSTKQTDINKSISIDYFHGNDGLTSKRFWEFIVNLKRKKCEQ